MSENYKLYRNVFDPTPFLKYIEESKKIIGNERTYIGPVIKSPEVLPDYTHWDNFHVINFLMNSYKSEILHEFIISASTIIEQIFEKGFPIHKERIWMIRTNGVVPYHTDTARTISLNLGLSKSDTAEVDVMNNNSEIETYTMNDGDVCLLNVKAMHTVKGIKGVDRYLLCYDFPTENYNTISNLINIGGK